MKTLRKKLVVLLTASFLVILTACGGGGGSDTGGGNNQTVTKSFTVSLANVEVTRISNGDAVDVDATEITSTGSVKISQ